MLVRPRRRRDVGAGFGGAAVRRGSEVQLPRLIVHIMDDVTLALGSVLLLGVIGFLIALREIRRDEARRRSKE